MHRVLHRVFYGPEVPEPAAKHKEVLALAADLVPAGGGWAWNQAVMEFGALRCTARKPGCEGCPIRTHCEAYPGMLEALAGLPRATRNGRAAKYEGSNLYLRGRVLAVLRGADQEGIALEEITRGVLNGTDGAGLARMRGVVASLEADGLARVLPGKDVEASGIPARAVSEERGVYRAGNSDGSEDLANLRMALP